MRKTILLLINGFGMEKKGSAEVYTASLMPNLDALMRNSLFGTLNANVGDYNNGYRVFSMNETEGSLKDEIDNLIEEKKLSSNAVLAEAASSSSIEQNTHMFITIEDASKLNQIREFLKVINPNKNKKVFIHLIFTGTSTSQYKDLSKVISKISFEMGEYAKVGMIVGKNQIDNDNTLRALYRELGEHWTEFEKKLAIMEREVVNPENVPIFMIGKGFSLKENDTIIFANYEDVEMDKVYADISKIPTKKYSFYPFKSEIPHMFERSSSSGSESFAGLVEKYGIKVLAFTNENKINDINFYLNGMKKVKSPNITFAKNNKGLFATKDNVINLVENNNYDGFILDYGISEYDKMSDIKNELASLDAIIKNISDASREKDYTFIISSLFGIHTPIMDGVVQKIVDFSGRVPCIFQSNSFQKGEYSISSGDTHSLALTFLTNINDDVKSNKLVHKLSKLEKMLSKSK